MQDTRRNKVLITGASRGVGLCIAKAMAKQGNNELFLVARGLDGLKKAEQEILKLSQDTKINLVVCDLGQPAQLESLFRQVPQVDVLINNAGVGVFGAFGKKEISEVVDMMRLNCETPVRLMDQYVKTMEKGRGVVVNIASLAGIFPIPYFSVYSATKSFLISLGEALKHEFNETGLKILTVCPAGIKTEFHIHAGLPNELVERFGKTMMTPEQIAEVVVKSIQGSSKIVVPGMGNKISVFLSRFSSKSIVSRILGSIYKKYDKS